MRYLLLAVVLTLAGCGHKPIEVVPRTVECLMIPTYPCTGGWPGMKAN